MYYYHIYILKTQVHIHEYQNKKIIVLDKFSILKKFIFLLYRSSFISMYNNNI